MKSLSIFSKRIQRIFEMDHSDLTRIFGWTRRRHRITTRWWNYADVSRCSVRCDIDTQDRMLDPFESLGRCTRAAIWNPNQRCCIKIAGNHKEANIFISYIFISPCARLLHSPSPLVLFSFFFLTFFGALDLRILIENGPNGNDIMITLELTTFTNAKHCAPR